MRKRLLLAAAAGLLLTASVGMGTLNAQGHSQAKDNTCADIGYTKYDGDSPKDAAWGYGEFQSDSGPLELTVNAGWEVEICVKKGSAAGNDPWDGPVYRGTYGPGTHSVNYRNVSDGATSQGFSHWGVIARTVTTQVVPQGPDVTQAVCENGSLTTPSVETATTANVSYQVSGTVAPGETVTVTASLTGDNVEWGTLPSGWSAGANNTAVFTVILDNPPCEPPPTDVTQVAPVGPTVIQAVCTAEGILTVPSVTPAADTGHIEYELIGDVEPGATVIVRASLVGDDVEWIEPLPTGWVANGDDVDFTVELDAPTCEVPTVVVPPFPATQPPLPPVQEQLPPPGPPQTPETPQPETPQPETPGVEAAPPPGAAPQAPTSLPTTGAATWIMAALATALLGAGVGMRRLGREA